MSYVDGCRRMDPWTTNSSSEARPRLCGSWGQGVGKICEYHAAISGDGAIVAVARLSRTQFGSGRRDAQSRGAQCADLRIGEAGYICGDPRHYVVVNVFVHGLVLSVQVTHAGAEQPAETRALAQFAVSRF